MAKQPKLSIRRSLYVGSKTSGKKAAAQPLDSSSDSVVTEDPRANNGRLTRFKPGEYVKGRGRKPAALEMRARDFILACINGEAGVKLLVQKVYALALKGQFRQQELLLNYIVGKPTDRIHIEASYAKGESAYSPIVKIIADHLRLEKLNKDAAQIVPTDAEVVSPERIEEMESVLNRAVGEKIVEQVKAEDSINIEKPRPPKNSVEKPTRKKEKVVTNADKYNSKVLNGSNTKKNKKAHKVKLKKR